MRTLLIALPALALTGCITVHPPDAVDTCRIEPAQGFIGRMATAATGLELLRATNTRELRWVPPGSMVTMDYRIGRLTVSYDQAMRITAISCG